MTDKPSNQLYKLPKRSVLENRRPGRITRPLALALVLFWRVRRRRSPTRVPHYYDQALRLLSRRGLVRAPATGVREFADSASQQLSEPAARAFSTLTECYLADRFGGRPPTRATADLQALRRALRPSRSRGAANTASESAIADPL